MRVNTESFERIELMLSFSRVNAGKSLRRLRRLRRLRMSWESCGLNKDERSQRNPFPPQFTATVRTDGGVERTRAMAFRRLLNHS